MLHHPIGQFQHPPGERDVSNPHLLDSAKTTSISGMGVVTDTLQLLHLMVQILRLLSVFYPLPSPKIFVTSELAASRCIT
jgi:hypothetical protein